MDGTRLRYVAATLTTAVWLSAQGTIADRGAASGDRASRYIQPATAQFPHFIPPSVPSLLDTSAPSSTPNSSAHYSALPSLSNPSASSASSDTLSPANYEALLRSVSDLDPGSGRALSALASGASASDLRWMMVTHSRRKRNVFQLGDMMKCATGCSPIAYKGYGCYCGFLGSGKVVDGIDHCCYEHDWCYWRASPCFTDPIGVSFYVSRYKWSCQDGKPKCAVGTGSACARQLCECDRQFAKCLRQYPCPQSRPVCTSSPLRHWQNLFLGMRKAGRREKYRRSLDDSYEAFE